MEDMVFGRRYRVTEKIGSGGMADVYKAVDETLGRTVAVKVMHARYAAEPSFAARFRQEAQAAANLQSPYVVNMYDWGQDGSTYYIVMEYVRGIDLKTLIAQKGALPSDRVADIGAQVCAALSTAHGYDIIHRDVKPHNIMITADGSAKVMDFGIARAGNTSITQTGSVLGTAQYVSPEQAQGRPLTAASDLYSLGVVLYEAATGRVPFEADTPVAVALKQVNEAPVPPRAVRASVDPALEAIILKAMAKNPSARYETADEMRRDLRRVGSGTAPAAMAVDAAGAAGPAVGASDQTAVMRPSGAATRRGASRATEPEAGRRGWVWPVVAVVLLLVALGTAWGLGLIGPSGASVPNVVGMQLAEAEKAIEDAGFLLGDTKQAFDASVPVGQVIDQSPLGNARAKKGTVVELTVSRGAQQVTVPNLVGLPEEDARKALTDAGLVPDPLPDDYSADYEAGIVFQQTPAKGVQAAAGSKVQFTVSRGKRLVIVPDVRGMKISAAKTALTDLGLKVSTTEQYSETIEAGKVISQSPLPDLEITEGSTISLVVSQGSALVQVPDVVGTDVEEAVATIENAGLVADVVYELHANNGLVLSQSPKGGKTVKRGSTVTLTIDAEAP